MNGNADWTAPADLAAAQGHFPGNPIVPGAVLLQEIMAAIAPDHPGHACLGVPAAKFHHPVRPGERIEIAWQGPAAAVRFTATLSHGARAVSGVLHFAPS